jgi:ElaB/YqjD/DUF883 family membrane-anchored ribosome-binding protein
LAPAWIFIAGFGLKGIAKKEELMKKSNKESKDCLAVLKMQRMDQELKEGKHRLISKEEALGKYAKLLK